MVQEIEVFVDSTDFKYEIGAGNAPGPHYIYNSLEEIKEKQPCVTECGVIRAKLVKVEEVLLSAHEVSPKLNHNISLVEKYTLMEKALKDIANFTHKKDCEYKDVPVYECGCYDKDPWEIATEALKQVQE